MKNTVDCGGGEEEERDLRRLIERMDSLCIFGDQRLRTRFEGRMSVLGVGGGRSI